MTHHAEIVAERIEHIVEDIPDKVTRYRTLVELMLDYADEIRTKTIADLTGNAGK